MNVQWGTFTRNGSVSDMLGEAERAMRGVGYQVLNSAGNNNSMVIGGNADVLVQATSMSTGPNQTFNIVSAFSQDASIAEQARNAIRDGMPNVIFFDQGTVGVPAEG
jgi:hypothetical protein